MTKPRTGQKQYAKTATHGFYLGGDDDKARRLAALEEAARLLGVRGASSVVQMVADLPAAVLAELLKNARRENGMEGL